MTIMEIMGKIWQYPLSLYLNLDRGFNLVGVLLKCRKTSSFSGIPK